MKTPSFTAVLWAGLFLIVLAVPFGVGLRSSGNAQDEAAPQGAAMPAIPLEVEIVKEEQVKLWKEFSGRITAVDMVSVRPEVGGKITQVNFKDGDVVAEGKVLFVIDPDPFKAAVSQAEAVLKGAQQDYTLAKKEFDRAAELIKSNAIARRVYDERNARKNAAWAAVEAAKAQAESAKINLAYTNVKAPISGKTGRVEITEGNLVQAGPNAPVLTTIVSSDGVYAEFDIDEQTYLHFVRSVPKVDEEVEADSEVKVSTPDSPRNEISEASIPIRMRLQGDGKVYTGALYSVDNRIDSSSGTIRARALFPNEDGAILPGMYASVEVGQPRSEEHILLPAGSIGTDQDRRFVYVVNGQGMTEYRAVTLGGSVDGKRVILSGLSVGDKVAVKGINKIFPGMAVKPLTAEQMKMMKQDMMKAQMDAVKQGGGHEPAKSDAPQPVEVELPSMEPSQEQSAEEQQ